MCFAVGAQGQIKGLDAWAETWAQATSPKWGGPRVFFPVGPQRPSVQEVTIEARYLPVALHGARTISAERWRTALQGVELMHEALGRLGWPEPAMDGGRGGTPGFDMYWAEGADHAAMIVGEAPALWSYLDTGVSYGLLDVSLPLDQLAACAASAYAEAVLFAVDPAEAPAWRRATAAYLVHQVTGETGCQGTPELFLEKPYQTFVAYDQVEPAVGAMGLRVLQNTQSPQGTDLIRTLWEHATQRTWEGVGVRAAPDLASTINFWFERHGVSTREWVMNFALERFRLSTLKASDAHAAVLPLSRHVNVNKLPFHAASDQPLMPLGSAYYRVDVDKENRRGHLRVWLRGEYGVDWGIEVVRLGERDTIQSRVSAPAQKSHRLYFDAEILKDTAAVLFVVTNLGERGFDADLPAQRERAFKLIVDKK